jgi:hypothetical protein
VLHSLFEEHLGQESKSLSHGFGPRSESYHVGQMTLQRRDEGINKFIVFPALQARVSKESDRCDLYLDN